MGYGRHCGRQSNQLSQGWATCSPFQVCLVETQFTPMFVWYVGIIELTEILLSPNSAPASLTPKNLNMVCPPDPGHRLLEVPGADEVGETVVRVTEVVVGLAVLLPGRHCDYLSCTRFNRFFPRI